MTKPKRRIMEYTPPRNIHSLNYEQLDSLLEADYNRAYQQYLLDLDTWNKKESKKDWLDKAEPYVDGVNVITSQIGKALEATGYGAPAGAIVETVGDVPGVILDGGQFVRDLYRNVRNPNPENRDNLTQDVLDLSSSIGDIWDPTGIGKDIYLGGKYGYQLMNSDKPTPPIRENTKRFYNRLHSKLEQDNT